MTRLTIELSGEEKHKIKTLAALHGQTLKDYVLERVLPDVGESREINALLLRSLTENKYSDWTDHDISNIRQKIRD